MIKLNDILNLTESEIKRTKIRFNQSNNINFDPIKLFKEKDNSLYDRHFGNYSKNKSFQVGQIAIGLVKIENDKWLLFDISEITKDLEKFNAVGYEYKALERYRKYFGRLIIKYKNKSQNLIRRADTVINDCEVFELISDTYEDEGFPGYDNIDLSWFELSKVLEKKIGALP